MKSIIFIVSFIVLGLWISWQQFPVEGNREPAAVRAHYNFAGLSQDKRDNTLKGHISRTFEVRAVADKTIFQFGYATFVDESQMTRSLCSVYSQVAFNFVAEGEAHNGEKPQLTVTAPCKENGMLAGEVIIPIDAIAAAPAADGEMQFFEPNQMSLSFKNIGEKWASTWYLTGISLQGSSGSIKLETSDLDGSPSAPFQKRQAHSFHIPVK